MCGNLARSSRGGHHGLQGPHHVVGVAPEAGSRIKGDGMRSELHVAPDLPNESAYATMRPMLTQREQ
jgi:hypothetical protein